MIFKLQPGEVPHHPITGEVQDCKPNYKLGILFCNFRMQGTDAIVYSKNGKDLPIPMSWCKIRKRRKKKIPEMDLVQDKIKERPSLEANLSLIQA